MGFIVLPNIYIKMTLQEILDQFRKGQLKKADFEAAIYNIINNHTHSVLVQELENEKRVFIREKFAEIYTSSTYYPDHPLELKPIHLVEDQYGEYIVTENGDVQNYVPQVDIEPGWQKKLFGAKTPKKPKRYSFNEEWGMRFAHKKAVELWNIFQTKLDEERRIIQDAQKKAEEDAKKVSQAKKHQMKVIKDEADK
jgi:hypothetical protein